MFKRLFLAILILSMSAADLSATEIYIGTGFGGKIESGSFREDLERFSEASGNAWKPFAGVRIGDYLAVEVARHDFGDQNCCEGFADLGFRSAVDGFSAAGLGRRPLGRFTPFAKIGVLSWNEDGEFITLIGPSPRSADGTDLLLGAGVDVALPASLEVRVEWERYEFADASTDSVWAALLFRF
jgi:hypothetical protein